MPDLSWDEGGRWLVVPHLRAARATRKERKMSIHLSNESAQAELQAVRCAGWLNCHLAYDEVLGWHVQCAMSKQPQDITEKLP